MGVRKALFRQPWAWTQLPQSSMYRFFKIAPSIWPTKYPWLCSPLQIIGFKPLTASVISGKIPCIAARDSQLILWLDLGIPCSYKLVGLWSLCACRAVDSLGNRLQVRGPRVTFSIMLAHGAVKSCLTAGNAIKAGCVATACGRLAGGTIIQARRRAD